MLAEGDRVRVKLDWPETRGPCHIRTPHYLRGREGVVERRLGSFRNPEDLAFARPAEERDLYHVRFDLPAIWQEADASEIVVCELIEQTYLLEDETSAGAGDVIVVELFEHWLEKLA